MNWLIDTFRLIAKKPAFYFGNRPATLSHLESFFIGIQVGTKCGDDLKVFDAFEEWVLWRHGVPKLNGNSFGHILHQAGGDEKKAFNLFFKYLEEYLAEREKIGPMGIRAGLHSFWDSKIRSIQDLKNDSFYEGYVNTLKKIFGEFLGWSEGQTMSYVEERLQNIGFRAWFGHNTPCDDASFVLIPELLKKQLTGLPLIRLHEKIWLVLEGKGDKHNVFPDTDPKFDWERAKKKVAQLLKDFQQGGKGEKAKGTRDKINRKNLRKRTSN
jgi:hypothetical protein